MPPTLDPSGSCQEFDVSVHLGVCVFKRFARKAEGRAATTATTSRYVLAHCASALNSQS